MNRPVPFPPHLAQLLHDRPELADLVSPNVAVVIEAGVSA